MAYGRNGERAANLAGLIDVGATYDIDRAEASGIVDRVVTTIRDNWDDVVDEVGLTKRQADFLYGSRILNPGILDGLPAALRR